MAEDGVRNLRLVEEPQVGSEDSIGEYLATLGGRSPATVDAYGRVLRQLAAWISEKPGGSDGFRPELLTWTAVEGFLSELEAKGHGPSHRAKAKSAISGFATWLIEEKVVLRRNPAIALWNAAHLPAAVEELRRRGENVPEEMLPHLSPLGWEHITLTGTYRWDLAAPSTLTAVLGDLRR